MVADGLVHPVDGFVHVLHQEGVVEHAQVGAEELTGLGEGIDAALDEQVGQHGVNPQFLRQLTHGSGISLLFDHPFFLDTHI